MCISCRPTVNELLSVEYWRDGPFKLIEHGADRQIIYKFIL